MGLVGVGKLGRAIATYDGFANQGFKVVGAFDVEPSKIGDTVGNLTIQRLDELCDTIKEKRVKIGIVAVPGSHAQDVIDTLIFCGIKAILNYAPISVHVPKGVRVRHIDPVVALQSMTFYIKSGEDCESKED